MGGPSRRKMPREMLRHCVNALDGTLFVLGTAKRSLHVTAQGLPSARSDPGMDAPICNNFDAPISQQQVNQYTAVVLGVPDAQEREDLDSPLTRGLAFQQRPAIQRAFHHKANFACMTDFGRLDGLLNGFHGLGRKGTADATACVRQVRQDPGEFVHPHLPDAPPPPKPPPPPPKPPPPWPRWPRPPMAANKPTPPASVNTSAISPAAKASDGAPAMNQVTPATTPPVTTAPGKRPINARKMLPKPSTKMTATGANCCPSLPPGLGRSCGAGRGSPSTTRMI